MVSPRFRTFVVRIQFKSHIMTKKTFCLVFAILALQSFGWIDVSTARAQSNSILSTKWTGSEPATVAAATTGSDGNTVFIYNVGKKLWLGRGGRWGTESVLSEVAQEFTLSGSDREGFKFKSTMRLHDKGADESSYLTMTNGTADVSTHDRLNYFLDQANVTYSTVKFTQVNTTDGSKVYQMYIHNSNATATQMVVADYYMVASRNANSSDPAGRTDYINGFLINDLPGDKSDEWILVTRQEYKEKFETANATEAQPVPGTFLVRDNDFSRNNLDVTYWKCVFDGTDHNLYNGVTTKSINTSDWNTYLHSPADAKAYGYIYYVGNGKANNNDQQTGGGKWTGNIHGANGKVHQKLDGIFREGWYQVRCHAFTTGAAGKAKLYASVDGITQKSTKFTEYAEDNLLTLKADGEPTPSTYLAANDVVNGSRVVDGQITYPYTASVLVYVQKNGDTMQSMQSMDFGIKVEDASADSWTSFDNFQIYYLGTTDNEIVLDEDRTSVDYMNKQNNQKAQDEKSTVYLHRSLNSGKWNSLVLPFAMNENQIQNTFGPGTIVSAFKGAIDENHPARIYFVETTEIKAGTLYIIKPSKGEPSNQPAVSASADPDHISFPEGSSYYTIPQVSYGQTGDFTAQVTGDKGSETYTQGQVQFVGTYVSDGVNASIPANSYVLKGGNSTGAGLWFYRTVPTKTKGFRGWLQQTQSGAKHVEFSINGVVDETTGIEGISSDSSGSMKASQGVYNLNGQLLRTSSDSLDGLPHGIYIVNGRKVVVE